MKKRLVAGLREVTKQVERNRVKIVFLAPDIQRCQETGGLDEAVQRLLDLARQAGLPVVYALSRRKIGRVLLKKVPVSVCGVLNYQATEETWKRLTEAVGTARNEYQVKRAQLAPAAAVSGDDEDDPHSSTGSGITEGSAGTMDVEMEETDVHEVGGPRETDALLQLIKLSLKDE